MYIFGRTREDLDVVCVSARDAPSSVKMEAGDVLLVSVRAFFTGTPSTPSCFLFGAAIVSIFITRPSVSSCRAWRFVCSLLQKSFCGAKSWQEPCVRRKRAETRCIALETAGASGQNIEFSNSSTTDSKSCNISTLTSAPGKNLPDPHFASNLSISLASGRGSCAKMSDYGGGGGGDDDMGMEYGAGE